jgi:hypothetical protein
MPGSLVIGLSAVTIAIQDGQALVLTVRPEGRDGLFGLPFGPFDPQGHRTFELALRAFVNEQTGFDLGYVEQLYTFGDKGRDAPLADVGAGSARVISVGYLALAPRAVAMTTPDTAWTPWTRFFPWEDWRSGRPPLLEAVIAPALTLWADRSEEKLSRARLLFALDGGRWNEERVLERYELLYEAGLVQEAARDRGQPAGCVLGEAMISDHRRILATGLGRLRGKLRYRPVVFAGIALHKQNFRRGLERTELVEGLGRLDAGTGGRPAELFRYRREQAALGPTGGLALPLLRDT